MTTSRVSIVLDPADEAAGCPAGRVGGGATACCVRGAGVEDKPWFHDEGFWVRYLSMLVSQRFNRPSLTLGLGYNYR